MEFEQLLENPKLYRCGDNYRAINIVFPVMFEGEKYVVKKAGLLSSVVNLYYALQDGLFYQTRGVGTATERLQREASCLKSLAGCSAPNICAYNGNTIHRKGVIVGDAHVKNILLSGYDAYWMDFDGYFYEQERFTALETIDILKFVYSTYSETRNEKMTLHAAEVARSHYEFDQNTVDLDLSTLRLWFPTRIPIDGRLNKEIKQILLR